MKKSTFRNYIENFQFQELFIDLGWNHMKGDPHPVRIDETMFYLKPISEKEGFHILLCSPDGEGAIPDYATRKKLETQITRLYREHLLIFTNEAGTEQLWQWMVRKPNQPARISDTRWSKGQSPELLYQKTSGLFFSLDEEENITIVDVKERVSKSFDKNNEKVTKTFYASFKKQHTRFLKFIKGIEKISDSEWYASLMLNRLMFCYFIQKKGFLDGDFDYLQNKLKACQDKKGENEFYNFYRDFLLALFHEGLGAPYQSESTEIELGTIPYLNGGLFDEHALERSYDIHIDDGAFESIFNFFDQWEWHLDTSHGATGKEINPDVIGYIFEKYINDRADMGAYYTKEDITDYISKNTILPYLFDETERNYSEPFQSDETIWNLLKESGDTYIYDAVKHGIPRENEDVKNWQHTKNWWESPVFDDLPVEMIAGLNPKQENLVDIREAWTITAPEKVALPTEIWREVIERRKRYVVVRQKIDNGDITQINDLITYNLNIRQFVQDVVENIDDTNFILHFYKSIAGDGKSRNPISVLDPTCGSGAFLFAALNILEPLYETCILRMRAFVEDEDRINSEDKETSRHKYKFFREVLKDIQSDYHPNQEYFVYKSIILRNLYGVDIMREAVEIAKLRLFLKMVATVDVDSDKPNMGLEPLPDIDFNIRAGNTLVGIGTEKEVDTLFDGFMDFDNTKESVQEKSEIVSMAFNHYKEIQLTYGEDYESYKAAKEELRNRLSDLRDELDVMLKKRHYPGKDLESWKESHQPFHWYAEFYDIIHDCGGFDVIIGNPPYVSTNKIDYNINESSFRTIECKDLYALTIERCENLLNRVGKYGVIIPLSAMATNTMEPLKNLLLSNTQKSWNSYYSASDQPASLFTGVRHRLMISINHKCVNDFVTHSTNFLKWFSDEREFSYTKIIKYQRVDQYSFDSNCKISNAIEASILKKLFTDPQLGKFTVKSGAQLYYHDAPVHWVKAFNFIPEYRVDGVMSRSSHLKSISFSKESFTHSVILVLHSNVFYWFNWQFTNCRDLSKGDIYQFRLDLEKFSKLNNEKINHLIMDLMEDLRKNSSVYTRVAKGKKSEFDSFYPMKSKAIIDSIDLLLADHFSLTNEEVDYIINYDIKYRMGSELEDG